MEASVGAIGFFFAALVVGVTHCSEIESASALQSRQEADAASIQTMVAN